MIKPDCKIIAVDNDISEINRITTAFNHLGVLCHTVLYNIGEAIPMKYTGIRIAFFDINLSGGSPTGTNLYNVACDALKTIIPLDNGPYALIFWSLHANEVEGLKTYIREREQTNIARPLVIDTIDKTTSTNPEVLISEIKRVLSKGSLETLLDFEDKAQKAASETLRSIFSLIPNGDLWGEHAEFEENYGKVLSKMAIDAVGDKHARKNPKESIKNAILPIFEHNLKKTSFDNSWDIPLAHLSKSEKVNYPENFITGELNAVYHLHKSDSFLKNTRGVVVQCLVSDEECRRTLNVQPSQILNEFIPFRKEIRPNIKKPLREKTECVFIEISALCDYAQQKTRISKYVLGLIYPIEAEELVDLNIRPDSLFRTPAFSIDNQLYYIGFNFKYVLGIDVNDDKLGEVKFCLSESLTNQISNRYANYTSRIGIVSY
jgi:hypothetical protein